MAIVRHLSACVCMYLPILYASACQKSSDFHKGITFKPDQETSTKPLLGRMERRIVTLAGVPNTPLKLSRRQRAQVLCPPVYLNKWNLIRTAGQVWSYQQRERNTGWNPVVRHNSRLTQFLFLNMKSTGNVTSEFTKSRVLQLELLSCTSESPLVHIQYVQVLGWGWGLKPRLTTRTLLFADSLAFESEHIWNRNTNLHYNSEDKI